jgi:hypothetical protein
MKVLDQISLLTLIMAHSPLDSQEGSWSTKALDSFGDSVRRVLENARTAGAGD